MQDKQTTEIKGGGGGDGIEDQLDHNLKSNDYNEKVKSTGTET